MSHGGDDWLRGKFVAVTGRFTSLSHEEVRSAIEDCGGCFQQEPSRKTRYLIVGEGELPLDDEARPTKSLTTARRLTAIGYPIEILGEGAFWQRLGVHESDAVAQRCTVAQICRILGVNRDSVRRWIRLGMIEPAATVHRLPLFDFSQIRTAKTLSKLVERGVPLTRVRRNLRRLGRWLPSAGVSLGQLSRIETTGRFQIRDANDRLIDSSGQLILDFPRLEASSPSEPSQRLLADAARTIDGWFAIAIACEDDGRYDDARRAYQAAAELEPDDAQVKFNLGNAYANLEEYQLAADAFEAALEIDPEYAEAWNNLGVVLSELGLGERAIVALKRALKLVPDYADAHFNLSEALAAAGLDEEAEFHRRRYERLDHNQRTAERLQDSTVSAPTESTSG